MKLPNQRGAGIPFVDPKTGERGTYWPGEDVPGARPIQFVTRAAPADPKAMSVHVRCDTQEEELDALVGDGIVFPGCTWRSWLWALVKLAGFGVIAWVLVSLLELAAVLVGGGA